MKKMICSFIFGIIFFATLAHAQINEIQEKLLSSKTLECEFPTGMGAEWGKESLKIEPDSMGKFIITNIDINNKVAKMIGKAGTSELRVRTSLIGLSFTSTDDVVFQITFITVFPVNVGQRKIEGLKVDDLKALQIPTAFVAVLSTHTLVPMSIHPLNMQPSPSQVYGYCIKKE